MRIALTLAALLLVGCAEVPTCEPVAGGALPSCSGSSTDVEDLVVLDENDAPIGVVLPYCDGQPYEIRWADDGYPRGWRFGDGATCGNDGGATCSDGSGPVCRMFESRPGETVSGP